MSDIVTVTWGGADVRVEMRPAGATVDSGHVGDGLPRLDRFDGCLGTPGEWNAWVRPCETINQGNGIEIGADGATAQEALDALAVKLREVRDWAAGVLQEPVFTIEQAHKVFKAAYEDDAITGYWEDFEAPLKGENES